MQFSVWRDKKEKIMTKYLSNKMDIGSNSMQENQSSDEQKNTASMLGVKKMPILIISKFCESTNWLLIFLLQK